LERKYKTQTEWVVQTLREAILSGKMKPGQKLRQEELAQQLDISPTPVREAFRQLEAEGLVVHLPHKGVRVTDVSAESVEEIYLIRSALESLAARLAVMRSQSADLNKLIQKLEGLQRSMEECLEKKNYQELVNLHEEFHMSLYEMSGSQRLRRLITSLRSLFPRISLWAIPERAARSMEEHKEILEAIRNRQAERTERLVSEHIERTMHFVVEYLRGVRQNPSLADEVMSLVTEKGGGEERNQNENEGFQSGFSS